MHRAPLGTAQDGAAQVGDEGGDPVLAGVHADDDPGDGVEFVAPGGASHPVLPAARASSSSRSQPSRTSSSAAPRTVDRVSPVASIASVAVNAAESKAYASSVSALVPRGGGMP